MALFLKQEQNQTELQKRIAAELQEKARKKAESADLPDGVEDSQYIKGTKRTTSLAAVWIILAALLVVVVIWYIVATAT